MNSTLLNMAYCKPIFESLSSVFLLLFLSCLLLASPAYGDWYRHSEPKMGTEVSVELWADSKLQAEQAILAVMTEMQRIDIAMNPWRENSELAAINREAAKGAMVISDEIFMLIQKAQYYSRLSDGAFDISFASLARFYDYRLGRSPTSAERQQFQQAINYRHIVLNENNKTLLFNDERLAIDLGGIAKGYAVDRGVSILQALDIKSAIVTAGGDSRVLGDRGGRPWLLGIRHPRKKGQHAIRIPLSDVAISTSGDYERFFIKEGKRIHHIINPDSGSSVVGVQSVSILAEKAVDSDALSTAVFVLGVGKGLHLVDSLPGVDAVIIDGDGLLHYSSDLLMTAKPAMKK